LKVLLVYETRFGNTKNVAEKVAEGMKEVEEIITEIMNVHDVEYGTVKAFDAIIICSPA
jgi:menaquinone-dependent protoporphyrinogen IX oxidase